MQSESDGDESEKESKAKVVNSFAKDTSCVSLSDI